MHPKTKSRFTYLGVSRRILPGFTLWFGFALVAGLSSEKAEANTQLCDLANAAIAGDVELSGEQRFQLAQLLKTTPHPTQAANGGRRLELSGRSAAQREAILNDLIAEFKKFYNLEGRYAVTEDTPNRQASPNQGGNKPHIFEDHDEMAQVFGPDYQQLLDIDPLSFRVATWAHDLGKARLDKVLQAYVAEKLKAAESNAVLNPTAGPNFVRQFVMSHDEHTLIDGLPDVISAIKEKHGLTDQEAADLMGQIVHNIAFHNFGPLHVDPRLGVAEQRRQLSERYPELTDAEIDRIRDAFWVKFYGNGLQIPKTEDGRLVTDDNGQTVMIAGVSPWASDMGLSPVHGQPRGATAHALAQNDRIALVTEGGIYKIPTQNLSRTGFNRSLLHQTFTSGDAIGLSTEALVKAEHIELMRLLPQGRRAPNPEEFRPTAYGLYVSGRATEFGTRLMKMNEDPVHRALNIDSAEAKHVLVYTDRIDNPKQGKTYKVDGGVQDSTTGKWPAPKVYQWDSASNGWKQLQGEEIPSSGFSGIERGTDSWNQILEFERLAIQARDNLASETRPYIIPPPSQWVQTSRRATP